MWNEYQFFHELKKIHWFNVYLTQLISFIDFIARSSLIFVRYLRLPPPFIKHSCLLNAPKFTISLFLCHFTLFCMDKMCDKNLSSRFLAQLHKNNPSLQNPKCLLKVDKDTKANVTMCRPAHKSRHTVNTISVFSSKTKSQDLREASSTVENLSAQQRKNFNMEMMSRPRISRPLKTKAVALCRFFSLMAVTIVLD